MNTLWHFMACERPPRQKFSIFVTSPWEGDFYFETNFHPQNLAKSLSDSVRAGDSPPLEGWQKFGEFMTGWFIYLQFH